MPADPGHAVRVSLGAIFREFLVVGATSFGGGIVAYLKILLTERRHWFSDDEFKAMLAIGQTMPGLNAVNIAVLAGDRLKGPLGAAAAVAGLLLPGCAFVLAAGTLYMNVNQGRAGAIDGFLLAVAAAATGLLTTVVLRLAGRQLGDLKYLAVALGTFALMSFANLSLPLVLLIAVPVSLVLNRPRSRGGA